MRIRLAHCKSCSLSAMVNLDSNSGAIVPNFESFADETYLRYLPALVDVKAVKPC